MQKHAKGTKGEDFYHEMRWLNTYLRLCGTETFPVDLPRAIPHCGCCMAV